MQVIRELIQRYYRHDVGRSGAALTYYLVFAILPLLVFFSSVLGALELDMESILHALDQLLPTEVQNLVQGYLLYVQENQSTRLMWFSLVFSIWFPMRATNCLLRSLQRAFGAQRPHVGLRAQLRTMLFTVWLMATTVATTALVTVGRRALVWISEYVALPMWAAEAWNGLRFIVLGIFLFAALAILYMLAQGGRRPLTEIAPGVLFSQAVWMILSAGFSYYVENFATYSELYGSIATAVVALLWLYISAVVIIMGGEFNAVILRRRQREGRTARLRQSAETPERENGEGTDPA